MRGAVELAGGWWIRSMGLHYGAWVYPEGVGRLIGWAAALKIIKFHNWNDGAFTVLRTWL